MAEIFVSYTHSDREWAFWIGEELEALGHTPHLHDWEVPGGGDIMAWMEARHDQADRVLCIVSKAYLAKPYSSLERRAAQWAAVADRPNFALPVFVEACKAPTLFAPLKRCDLYGIVEDDARARLRTFLEPAGKRSRRTPFPGEANRQPGTIRRSTGPRFPGKTALSNIPIGVPRYFLGREDAIAAIEMALRRDAGRVALTALHGLRGVGKTTLAAAYAERHQSRYRVTWWIRAQKVSGITSDLFALGIRLGWVGRYEKEKTALTIVMERLRYEGKGILLIFDNATDAEALKPFLPRGGRSQTLITSTTGVWRGVAAPVEINVWPINIGADYLIARTGRENERPAAEALSQALGGLPLALEQAAAYCERLSISLEAYHRRFEIAPTQLLDSNALTDYHDGLTVAKTFGLAIKEAGKLHPAAEALIVYAALLAPEPIPLFIFTEAGKKFGEPLASFQNGGIDEAVAALSNFSLVERETVVDERDPAIATDTIRLHRLVRLVAAERAGNLLDYRRAVLLDALATVYPDRIIGHSESWPRARRLDGLALALTEPSNIPSRPEWWASSARDRFRKTSLQIPWMFSQAQHLVHGLSAADDSRRARKYKRWRLGEWLRLQTSVFGHFREGWRLMRALIVAEQRASELLVGLASYRRRVLEDYSQARALYERALAIRERLLGQEHSATVVVIHALGSVLLEQGNLVDARSYFERAVAHWDKQLDSNAETSVALGSLANVIRCQGDISGARMLAERALRISEEVNGADHRLTGICLNDLALIMLDLGDLPAARSMHERALTITEKLLGPESVEVASILNNLALVLHQQGDFAGARSLAERALAIEEKVFGPEHSSTANAFTLLANILHSQGELTRARLLADKADAIRQRVAGLRAPTSD